MILHIPHSGTRLPEIMFDDLLISESQLQHEIALMTDHYCDDLFQYPDAHRIAVPWSRLFCDVERFESDSEEPMSAYGQGMYYSKTFAGVPLRNDTYSGRQEATRLYRQHHLELTRTVDDELATNGSSMIVDCHSFSNSNVRIESATEPYPDVCIGVDAFHTPPDVANAVFSQVRALGYSAAMNYPFSGSIVPLKHYKKNAHVMSIMIEINRALYLTGNTNEKSNRYGNTKQLCSELLASISTVYRDCAVAAFA